MRGAFAVLLLVHGMIHGARFAKAFGLAELPRLSQPISRARGILWLAAGLGFVAAAVLLLAGGSWWMAAAPALVLSQALVFVSFRLASFRDARLGTLANAVVLVPLVLAMLELRASSLPSRYARDVREQLDRRAAAAAPAGAPRLVTEAELTPLPPPVQKYLRRAGVVGKPHVSSFRASFRARMRMRPDAAWMDATAEQYEFFGPPGPARLFFMEASRSGIPFAAFHRYVGDAASMEVRALGLIGVADARGPHMTQSETVTLLNDMCVLAPAALLEARVSWKTLGPRRVQATYSNAGKTVSALLTFDEAGDLTGFVSHDRYQSDGKTEQLLPWSTPLGDYRAFEGVGVRLASHGEARWVEPSGEWTYGDFTVREIAYDVREPP